MSDALPLPPRPDLEQYRKRAKELVKLSKSGDSAAIAHWLREWIRTLIEHHHLAITFPTSDDGTLADAEIDRQIDSISERITKHLNKSPESSRASRLSGAQFFLARAHGFASWPKFARHLRGLAQERSAISAFEAAADALIHGDVGTLKRLLADNPALVHARSMHDHHSTLLHYVAANGVEDFRQKTPANVLEIAELLLEAGADVNAESDAYGGRSTTLGLAATSYHPEAAGVQLALLELLIQHGAMIDAPDGASTVNACLHNGRGIAAEFLADRGARLDLEGAAGVGRLDVVRSFFTEDGKLKPPATPEQMRAGFAWACEFGRTEIVRFLLEKGMEPGAKLSAAGEETGLHWAAYEGHMDIVRLLLEHGAPVDIQDKRYGGTPLGWALYGWVTRPEKLDRPGYYEVVALLVRAGAKLDPRWFENDIDRQRVKKRIDSDPIMAQALRGTAFHIEDRT